MIEMLVGALILLIGIVIGRLSNRLRPRPKFLEPKAVCGCKHSYAFHNEQGVCQYSPDQHWEGKKLIYDLCGCQRYTGPEPLPTYTAEIGP